MLATTLPIRTGNRLLDRLPADELNALARAWERVQEVSGHEVYRQLGPMPYAYFPLRGVYSVVVVSGEGDRTEAATVGNEGVVGLSAYLGLDFSPHQVIVQVPGEALRLPTPAFLAVARPRNGGPPSALGRLMQCYAAYALRYANQTIVCNVRHSIEQRACRWLLMAHDRAGCDDFLMTHEFLAEMLGVRRQSVTVVAGALQRDGLITYSRGNIRVLDRRGLESSACECYGATCELYDRIMSGPR